MQKKASRARMQRYPQLQNKKTSVVKDIPGSVIDMLVKKVVLLVKNGNTYMKKIKILLIKSRLKKKLTS